MRDLEKAGDYDQAISILQEVTAAEPNKDLLWAYLGDAYRGAKKYPEAIEAYQKALAINPNSGAYHNGLADAYAKSGQTDKAVAEYAAAAQAEPANAATYYFNEGAIFTNTGKVDEAISAFDKTIQTDPSRAEAYYYKGINLMSKATTGKDGKFVAPAGTAEAFKKYLELKPDGHWPNPRKTCWPASALLSRPRLVSKKLLRRRRRNRINCNRSARAAACRPFLLRVTRRFGMVGCVQ